MRNPNPETELYQRVYTAAVVLLSVALIGALGYLVIGGGRWSFLQCLYMTVTTLSTVGFGELLQGMSAMPLARAWTAGLIVLGSGTVLYFVSTLTATLLEGDIQHIFRRKRMREQIHQLSDHVVVCGVGSTGAYVVEELLACETPFVAIDLNPDRIRHLQEELGMDFLFVVGDAADDATMHLAGVQRAKGIVAALTDDKDNLFVTITARALNPTARIVAKSVEVASTPKLRRAGADSVVSPNLIGGLRMASEMLRPTVVEFLDAMLRDKQLNLRIEEVVVKEGNSIVGLPLSNPQVREYTGALLLALRKPNGTYVYDPKGDSVVEAGVTLIVIGPAAELHRLKRNS